MVCFCFSLAFLLGLADMTFFCSAGVAVLSKHKPLSIAKDLPGHPDADAVRGRIVTLEFEKLYLVCTYVTNAGQGLKVWYFSPMLSFALGTFLIR